MKQGFASRRKAVLKCIAILSLATLAVAGPAVVAGSPAVGGPTVIVAGDRQEVALDEYLRFVEDRERRVQQAPLLANPDRVAWDPAGQALRRGGTSRSRWWIRADLYNADPNDRERVFVIGHPSLDDIRFSLICANGLRAEAIGGNAFPYSRHPLPNRLAAFPVTLPAGTHCTAIFAVTDDDSFRFPLVLQDEHGYRRAVQNDYLARGVTFGMQTLLALLGLLAALLRRDALPARYALAVLSQMAMVLVLSNAGYSLFWPEAPRFQKAIAPTMLALAWGFTVTFCLRLLPDPVTRGTAAHIVRGSSLLTLAAALLQVLLPDAAHQALLVGIIAFGLILLLVMSLGAMLIGESDAPLATAGIVTLSLGGLVEALAWLGLMPLDLDFLFPVQAGFIISAVIFAALLVWRGLEERNAHQAESELNRRVAERTRELTSTLARLTSQNRQLDRLSCSDALTGAFNRRFLDSCLPAVAGDNSNLPLSFILFDIDYFKQVNDRHGHLVGDDCLRQVASRVQMQLREHQDVLCRFGGEEFAVILPKTDRAGAEIVAEKIRAAVAASPIDCAAGPSLPVTISLGVATLGTLQELSHLVDDADHALYAAKKNGRNRCQFAPA